MLRNDFEFMNILDFRIDMRVYRCRCLSHISRGRPNRKPGSIADGRNRVPAIPMRRVLVEKFGEQPVQIGMKLLQPFCVLKETLDGNGEHLGFIF